MRVDFKWQISHHSGAPPGAVITVVAARDAMGSTREAWTHSAGCALFRLPVLLRNLLHTGYSAFFLGVLKLLCKQLSRICSVFIVWVIGFTDPSLETESHVFRPFFKYCKSFLKFNLIFFIIF